MSISQPSNTIEDGFSVLPPGMAEDKVRDYFFYLRAHNYNFAEFQQNWLLIDSTSSRKTLYNAIRSIGILQHKLSDKKNEELDEFLESPEGIDSLTEMLKPKLRYLPYRELIHIGWSLEERGIQPPLSFLRTWRNLARYGLPNSDDRDLIDQIRTFHGLYVYPGSDFMSVWFEHATERLGRMPLEKMPYLVWMLGGMGARAPASFMRACEDYMEGELAKTDNERNPDYPNHLRRYLDGMAALSAASDCNVRKNHIRKVMDKVFELDGSNPDTDNIFFHVGAYFGIAGDFMNRQVSRRIPDWKIPLKESFSNAAGFLSDDDIQIPGLRNVPDIIGYYKDKRIIIQFDDIPNFYDRLDDRELRLNGSTRLQSALLRKAEPKARILRLCCVNFNDVANDLEASDYEYVLKKLSDIKPGIYKSVISPGEPRFKAI